MDLLDDEDGERRLVPGQSLGRRVLDRPVEQSSTRMTIQFKRTSTFDQKSA